MSQPKISIGSVLIAVPYEISKTYYDNDIVKEGGYRKEENVPIVLIPSSMAGSTNKKFSEWVFNKMDFVRKNFDNHPVTIENQKIDIGILDIQVIFEGDQNVLHQLLKQNPQSLFIENAKHFEMLCKGQVHDQMVLASFIKLFNRNGKPSLHYSNLVFGVRIENEKTGLLDFEPLLGAISGGGKKINVASGIMH